MEKRVLIVHPDAEIIESICKIARDVARERAHQLLIERATTDMEPERPGSTGLTQPEL